MSFYVECSVSSRLWKYIFLSSDIECLDMDTYEKNVLRKGQPDCTVDAVIGISTYENNRVSSPRLLLVELRMDYDNIKRIFLRQLWKTRWFTPRNCLAEVAIELKSIFLFKEKLASQAKSWFNRQSRTGGELNNCRACSVQNFILLNRLLIFLIHRYIRKKIQQNWFKETWKYCWLETVSWTNKILAWNSWKI